VQRAHTHRARLRFEDPTATTRKEQSQLSGPEWDALIAAIDTMHGADVAPPRYREFVAVHVDSMGPGMAWGVHLMAGMGPEMGRNFLAWHRQFIVQFERRLQAANPAVSLPYWDWIASPVPPAPLSDPTLLQRWSVQRGEFQPAYMPTQEMVDAAKRSPTFLGFQQAIEKVHDGPHNAIGGDMGTSRSPNDPVFFLHHANIDRLWAEWQSQSPGQDPPNSTEVLQPSPLFEIPVSSVLKIETLGYAYG
jgi:tyrosinase